MHVKNYYTDGWSIGLKFANLIKGGPGANGQSTLGEMAVENDNEKGFGKIC